MSRTLWAALAVLLALAASGWGLYQLGQRVARGDAAQAQAAEVARAVRTYQTNVAHAEQAASGLRADLAQQASVAADLQQQLQAQQGPAHENTPHIPLLHRPECRRADPPLVGAEHAAGPVDGSTLAGDDLSPVALRSASGGVSGAGAAAGAQQLLDRGGDLLPLTAAALRLWNSALAGEHLPIGACRADEPTSSACAAETEVTLADAWANHLHNAALCAADRAAHGRLIDYLHRVASPTGHPTERPTSPTEESPTP